MKVIHTLSLPTGLIFLPPPMANTALSRKNRPIFWRPIVAIGLLCAIVFLLSGCSTSLQRLDPEFGKCLEAGLAAQAINLEAPTDPTPADSLPGELASQIYNKRYVKTMTEEKKEGDNAASQLSGLD
jgi:hypothetical protein